MCLVRVTLPISTHELKIGDTFFGVVSTASPLGATPRVTSLGKVRRYITPIRPELRIARPPI